MSESDEKKQLCGEYVGDNDGTCPQIKCIRTKGHEPPCDNVRGDEEAPPLDSESCRAYRERFGDDINPASPIALWVRDLLARRPEPAQRPSEAPPRLPPPTSSATDQELLALPVVMLSEVTRERYEALRLLAVGLAHRAAPCPNEARTNADLSMWTGYLPIDCPACGDGKLEAALCRLPSDLGTIEVHSIVCEKCGRDDWDQERDPYPVRQRPEPASPPPVTYAELETAFIEAYAFFVRQAWDGLKRSEADRLRSACIDGFDAVKRKFSELRRIGDPGDAWRLRQFFEIKKALEKDGTVPAANCFASAVRGLLRERRKQKEAPERVRIVRNDLMPSMPYGTLATVTERKDGIVYLDVDCWGPGFCTSEENVVPLRTVVVDNACGDVRAGKMVARCECGLFREAGRAHGYREAEQDRAKAAVAAVKELEDAATEREAETHLGTLYDIKRAEERLEKARAVAMEYATKPLYVVSTSTRVGDR